MNGQLWRVKRWLRLRSREGAAGLVLLTAGLIFYVAIYRPAQAQLQQSLQEQSLATEDRRPARSTPDIEAQATQQLATFYKFFPAQETAPGWLGKIYKAAEKENIALLEGEYREQRQQTGKLMRYQVTLPVKGPYVQVRRFVSDVLAEIPIASLDHISFERQRIEDPLIDAKITFTLYLEPPT